MSTRVRAPAGQSALPTVVIAGRPNVGKSSLVNRIVGRRAAVVEAQAGVTRDRKALDAEWNGVPFRVMDTGGWLAGGDSLDAKVSAQAEHAVSDADLVLFVVDVAVGVTDEDLSAAKVLRRSGAPIRLVVNKVDDARREAEAWEFVSLGLGDPWLVSALHRPRYRRSARRGGGAAAPERPFARRPDPRRRSPRWPRPSRRRSGVRGRRRRS